MSLFVKAAGIFFVVMGVMSAIAETGDPKLAVVQGTLFWIWGEVLAIRGE